MRFVAVRTECGYHGGATGVVEPVEIGTENIVIARATIPVLKKVEETMLFLGFESMIFLFAVKIS